MAWCHELRSPITEVETTRHQHFYVSACAGSQNINHQEYYEALITRKVGMTSTIAEDGVTQAVTLLSASPCVITQVKTVDKDGYTAVQLGAEEGKNIVSPKSAILRPAGVTVMPKIVREFRVDEITEDLKVGEKINPEVFSVGDVVNVTGTSKGKGWAGTIRRHNFHAAARLTVAGLTAARVHRFDVSAAHFKGKRMAGQLGDEQVTVRNLKVALIDTELGVIGVAGAVPGPRHGIVILKGVN